MKKEAHVVFRYISWIGKLKIKFWVLNRRERRKGIRLELGNRISRIKIIYHLWLGIVSGISLMYCILRSSWRTLWPICLSLLWYGVVIRRFFFLYKIIVEEIVWREFVYCRGQIDNIHFKKLFLFLLNLALSCNFVLVLFQK